MSEYTHPPCCDHTGMDHGHCHDCYDTGHCHAPDVVAPDIASWLLAIYAEEEKDLSKLVSTNPPGWYWDGECLPDELAVDWVASVLADIAAKRAIVKLHRPDRELENWFWMDRKCRECGGSWHSYPPSTSPTDIGPEKGCRTLRLLASAHADRPGYQAEWAVG